MNEKKGIELRNRNKILLMPNLYSRENNVGILEPIVEIMFSQKIDSWIPDFVKFTETTTFGDRSDLAYINSCAAARKLALNFFYRSPYTHEKIESMPYMRLAYGLSYLSDFLLLGKFPNPDRKRMLRRNLLQQQLVQSVQMSISSTSSQHICFVYCDPGEEFISGSNPLILPETSMFGVSYLLKKRQKNWFLPISPRVGILIGDSLKDVKFASIASGSSEALNLMIFKQSRRVFSRSRDVLNKIILNC